jgi:hypothetical protein
VVKYSSRSDALAALHKLLTKQAAEGFETLREPSGRYSSCHPDRRKVEFWVDDANGDIVESRASGTVAQGLEADCSALRAAHPS